MSGETINIGRGQGLTQGFKKLLEQKMANGEIETIDFKKVKLSQWQKVIQKFADINDTRIQNKNQTIFTGGSKVNAINATATNKGDNTWAKNMVVQEGNIELDETEMQMLYDAFGVRFTQKDPATVTATGTGTVANAGTETIAVTTTTATATATGTGTVANAGTETIAVTTTTATATGTGTVANTGTGTIAVTTTTGTTAATDVTLVTEPVGNGIRVGGPDPAGYKAPKTATPKKPTIPSVTFNRADFDKKVKDATMSADIVNAQKEAINIGIKLRDEATKVDLKALNNYGEEGCKECWGQVVNGYFENEKGRVYNQPVKGGDYDSDATTIKDRVLAGDPDNEMTLQQELNETNLQTLISEDANVDLDKITINGKNILEVKDLTLADDNATIDKTGKDLENAAAEIKKGIVNVDEKLKAARGNVAAENARINSQLDIIETHRSNIETLLSDIDPAFANEYKTNKTTIDGTEYESYEDYGKFQFAREAADKQLLLAQVRNIKVTKDGEGSNYSWDLSGIDDQTVKTNTENALKRLLNKYGDELQSELNAIGAAGAEIETARKGIVEAMQTVVRLEIVKQQLENLRSDLDEKALQLTTISQNLKGIDDFVKIAGEKAKKMYEDEKNDASNAEAAAMKKLGKIQTRANTSRTINEGDDNRASYDGSGDEKITKKSGKEIVKGQKLSPKAKRLIDEQKRTATIVQKHDRAVYDLEEAQNRYQVQEVAAAVPAEPVVITSVDQVQNETLKSKYSLFISHLTGYTDKIDFKIEGNNIVIYSKNGEKLTQFNEQTVDAAIPTLCTGIKAKLNQ